MAKLVGEVEVYARFVEAEVCQFMKAEVNAKICAKIFRS